MEKALKVLEWEKIIKEIEKDAETTGGKEQILNLRPITEIDIIRRWHLLNEEALKTVYSLGYPTFSGVKDLRNYIEKAEIGGIIYPEEFEEIANTLETFKKLKDYQNKAKNLAPNLWGRNIYVLPDLYSQIRKAIQNAEVLDTASPELKSIRQKKERINQKIKETLNVIINKDWRTYLQEQIVTIRHGRYVVPVKQEFKTKIPGIVHDQSTSGLTVYVEPLSIVELNNQLSLLEIEEKKEIEKILRKLSLKFLEHKEEILETLNTVFYLDFVYAKIKWAQRYNATIPIIDENPVIIIREGRHPFLGEKAVPISLEVGRRFNTLVITGPNTGGKTVTLKTIGLFVLLNQAGVPVPAKEGTVLGIFNQVFPDIGDEQSIEQNLSTFSSHMTNIISFIDYLERTGDKRVLVILDELGAGTDPQEGAALAVALLEYFHNKGTINVIATHFPQLKILASKYEGMENASLEFDENTLKPLYKINIGIPGKSNALLIAKKLGLPRKILDRAMGFLSEEEIELEEVIGELQRGRRRLEEEIERVERLKRELQEEKRRIEEEKRNIQKEKEELKDKQKKEIFKELLDVENRVKDVIRELQKGNLSMKEAQKLQEDIRLIKKDLISQKEFDNVEYIPQEGDRVRIKNTKKEGIVLDIDREKKIATVQVGIIKINVNWNELEQALPKEEQIINKYIYVQRENKENIPSEISIRMMTVDEALEELKKYLEKAFLAGLRRVRIIHGKGTGKLRNAVHEYLKSVPYVKEFYLASPAEGGEGATIAILESPV
jgi:DNA mismatch repair protein MutS2